MLPTADGPVRVALPEDAWKEFKIGQQLDRAAPAQVVDASQQRHRAHQRGAATRRNTQRLSSGGRMIGGRHIAGLTLSATSSCYGFALRRDGFVEVPTSFSV